MGQNLTGQTIASTYEDLVQISGSRLTDGTGSNIDNLTVTASLATNAINATSASFATTSISASHAVNSDIAVSASFATNALTATSASFATNAISSSFATTSISASFALTASFAENVTPTNTGSLMVTGSATLNTLTFTKGDGSTFNLTVDTGSVVAVNTGSLLVTASISNADITFTKGDASTFSITVNNVQNASTASIATSASFAASATSASHALNSDAAISSSFATTSISASFATNSISASFATSALQATSASFATTATSASHAVNADTTISSSFATTSISASHALNANTAVSASFALTASFAENVIATNTGSFYVSSSVANATITFNQGDGTTEAVTVNNVSNASTASIATSASFATTSISSSFATSASFATTASFALNVSSPSLQQVTDVGASTNDTLLLSGNTNAGGNQATIISTNALVVSSSSYPVVNIIATNPGVTPPELIFTNSTTLQGTIRSVGSGLEIQPATGPLTIIGNEVVSGSLSVTSGITGSLLGTASFATTASFALNAAAAFPFTGSAQITGSLSVTGSINVRSGSFSGSVIDNITDTFTTSPPVEHVISLTQAEYNTISASADVNTLYYITDAAPSPNIYNSNGALTSNRVVDFAGYNLDFDMTNGESFTIDTTALGDIKFTNLTQTTQSQVIGYNSSTGKLTAMNTSSFGGGAVFPFTGSAIITGSLVITGSVRGNVSALSISSNTASLDLSNGNFYTLQLVSGSNTLINPSNIVAGQTINLRINTTGSATVSFPSSVKQVSGSAYVPTTTTSTDIVTFISFDTGSLFLSNVKNLV